MMQIVAAIWEIKLAEAAEIIREVEREKRENTQRTAEIGGSLPPPNLEPKKHRLPEEETADKRIVEQSGMAQESGGEALTCGWVVLEHSRWC